MRLDCYGVTTLEHFALTIKNKGEGMYPIFRLDKFWSKVIICVVLGVIVAFSYQGDNAFIYFQF